MKEKQESSYHESFKPVLVCNWIIFFLVTRNRKRRSINAESSTAYNTNSQGVSQGIETFGEKPIEIAAQATSLGIEMLFFINKDIYNLLH